MAGPGSGDPTDPTHLPVSRVPGYRDLRLHRHGSSAEVYRATRERDGVTVAIKLLRLDEMTTYQQFEQELAVALRLSAQPHVVRILDTGVVDGRPYLVMEFCPDGSYDDVVSRHGPLSVRDAVDVGIAIAEALHAAHQMGVIHRDVTPGNILRAGHGPALADFGIARRPLDLSGTVTLHKLTPHHAAPEALLRQPQSAASDVYSLGSTLWQLLAGYPPFAQQGEQVDPFTYRDRVLERPAPLIPRPDVPVWLQTEIARALAKAPADRHPSAAAFAEALRQGWQNWTGQAWRSPDSYPPLGDARTATSPVAGSDRAATGGANRAPASPADAHQGWPDSGWADSARADSEWADSGRGVAGSVGSGGIGYRSGAVETSGFGRGELASDGMSGATPRGSVPSPDEDRTGSAVEVAHLGEAAAATASDTASPAVSRRRGAVAYLVAGVIGALLAGLIVVFFTVVPGTPDAAPQQTPTVTASVSTDLAPTDVRLEDHGSSVVISWTDRTGGTAPHYVVGGPVGTTPHAMTQAEKGVTEVTIDALNPDTDYCFTVIAVISVDEVAPSGQICTDRS